MRAVFTALAVLLDFLLQVTAFVALIVFDFLRSEDKRVDCFPCLKVSRAPLDSDKGKASVPVYPTEMHQIVSRERNKLKRIFSLCVGTARRKPGLLSRYMKVTN